MLQAVPRLTVDQTGPRPIELVQFKAYGSTVQQNLHSVTFDAAPTAGNLIVFGAVGDATALPVPPNGRWSATKFASSVDFTGTYLFWLISNGSEQTNSILLTTGVHCCLGAMEFRGINSVNAWDQSANANGQGPNTVGTGTTGTTTKAYELLVAIVGLSFGNTTPPPAVTSYNNSFTSILSAIATGAGSIVRIDMATRVVTSTGTYTTTATLAAAGSSNNSGIIATFNN